MAAISIIAAIDSNGLIGHANDLPWKIKEDLEHFQKVTMGHPIVMGKNTWISIGKPLAGRTNIIMTHDKSFSYPGCIVINSIDQVLSDNESGEIFIIGGAEIFELYLPYASKMYLTRIHHEFSGDIYFPKVDWSNWQLTMCEEIESTIGLTLSFELWQKKMCSSLSDTATS